MHSLYPHGPKINEDILMSYKCWQKLSVMINDFGTEALKSHD